MTAEPTPAKKTAARKAPAKTATPAKKTTKAVPAKPARIDHSECDHPRTWAGREACRQARRKAES